MYKRGIIVILVQPTANPLHTANRYYRVKKAITGTATGTVDTAKKDFTDTYRILKIFILKNSVKLLKSSLLICKYT